MSDTLGQALQSLRARRGRAVLAGLGIAMAAAMLSTAATVGYGLSTGFPRSARAADLPDVIARFQAQPASEIAQRIAALPDIAALSLGREYRGVALSAGAHRSGDGIVEAVGSGRRGYAVVAGHDVSGAGTGVVLEEGVARSWNLRVGESIGVGAIGPQRIVGLAQAPDNVAYPLAAPRLYTSLAALGKRAPLGLSTRRLFLGGPRLRALALPGQRALPRPLVPPASGVAPRPRRLGVRAALLRAAVGRVNMARIWLRDPAQLNSVLVQARTTSYGLRDLRLITRSGVRLLLDEAAGIVLALLGALSAIALLTAGVMLAASARAEVQRRLYALGVLRALGGSRLHLALVAALEALLVALPAAAIGVGAGALAASGPDDRLLALLNERGPGGAVALPLAGCVGIAVVLPTVMGAWPAWRAAGRPPIELLRGMELSANPASATRPLRGGLARLGVRLAAARRLRLAATLSLLGISAAFVLLMLALASELTTLENDPKALGRRYQLTASLPASEARSVARTPGVQGAAPRYELTALDSFSLGETVDVIAYGGPQGAFEAPPLLAGRRRHGTREAEVGNGLAQVLGLSVGSTLALALPSGSELRLRVAGILSSLSHDGRVAYVPASTLLASEPSAPEQIAVRVKPNVSASSVEARLGALGASVSKTKTITGQGNSLVAALTAVLRAVAVVDGLVCLYALIQALALTAHERRATIALLRACGAGSGAVLTLLAGAALAVVAPAAVAAVLLERIALGPEMARIAASYVSLALAAGVGEVALLVCGLALLTAIAVWWVGREACREPVSARLA